MIASINPVIPTRNFWRWRESSCSSQTTTCRAVIRWKLSGDSAANVVQHAVDWWVVMRSAAFTMRDCLPTLGHMLCLQLICNSTPQNNYFRFLTFLLAHCLLAFICFKHIENKSHANQQDLKIVDFHFGKYEWFSLTWSCVSETQLQVGKNSN